MNEIQLVSRNSLMLGLRELVLKLSGFITFPIIARSIGVSVLGILGTAQAFSGMLFLIADLGLNKSLIKEVSQNKKDTDVIFSNAIMLKAASMLMALLIGLFLIKFSDLDEVSTKLGILVLLLGFIGGFDELIKSMFSGHEKMEFLPILDGLSKVSTLIAVILIFLILKGSIIELQICSIFITVGIIVLSLKFFMTKVHKIKFNLRVGMLANLLKASIPFMMVGFFAHSFGFIDSLMLASMLGRDAVGLYQIAYKLVVYLQLIPATVSIALFPTLSRLYVEDYSKFEYGLKRVFKYLFLLSIPTAISLNLMGPVLIKTIFGLEFEGSVILFQLLTWSLILNFITFPLGVSLGVSGNQKLNVITLVCGSISNIVSNYLFIGFWGINGVAISTVLSAGIVFLCSIYFFKKVFSKIVIVERSLFYILLFLIIFWGFKYLLVLECLMSVCVFNFSFLIGILLLKAVDREDRMIFGKILRIS